MGKTCVRCGKEIGFRLKPSDFCSVDCSGERRRIPRIVRLVKDQVDMTLLPAAEGLSPLAKRQRISRVFNPGRAILWRVKAGAKTRGIPFSLTQEDLPPIPEKCPVLGIKLTLEVGNGHCKPSSVSLDRIDNNVGYTKSNVRFISNRANGLKSDATDEELIALGKDAASRSHTRPEP